MRHEGGGISSAGGARIINITRRQAAVSGEAAVPGRLAAAAAAAAPTGLPRPPGKLRLKMDSESAPPGESAAGPAPGTATPARTGERGLLAPAPVGLQSRSSPSARPSDATREGNGAAYAAWPAATGFGAICSWRSSGDGGDSGSGEYPPASGAAAGTKAGGGGGTSGCCSSGGTGSSEGASAGGLGCRGVCCWLAAVVVASEVLLEAVVHDVDACDDAAYVEVATLRCVSPLHRYDAADGCSDGTSAAAAA
mmetsp:Transcript_32780/g.99846  ORF Transcript_32780/g.99846 Transcript_32780/m.99846 type:complete len:252 (+) Transcript_32780:139-894(+)